MANSLSLPPWLDEDFLYTLNYGPANSKAFTMRVESVIHVLGESEQRERITLLDRFVAVQLHEAIFSEQYGGPRFLKDWADGPKWLVLRSAGSITPFDYDPLASETRLFMNTETFITTEILDPYSLRSSLCNPRPSMVPITLDIIDLVTFFRSLPPTGPSKRVDEWLSDFLTKHQLRTVDAVVEINRVDSAAEHKKVIRYLVDMLKSVTYLPDDSHWEVLGRTFPSAHFILGDSPSTPSSSLTQIFLDDFTADFICSGPFKLIPTEDIRQHLRLTEKHEIQVFLNFAQFLSMYNNHSFRRYFHFFTNSQDICTSITFPKK